jgi:hypothetical protein
MTLKLCAGPMGRGPVIGLACVQCDRWFLLTSDGLLSLQDFLADHPEIGDILQVLATTARRRP